MVATQSVRTVAREFGRAVPRDDGKVYLVGAGIASPAAAAFLIRDGDKRGSAITFLEESAAVGGALDAAGDPVAGYALRDGRMLESKILCTFDLFESSPTLDDRMTVTQEIFDRNRTMKTSSKSLLFAHVQRITGPEHVTLATRHHPMRTQHGFECGTAPGN